MQSEPSKNAICPNGINSLAIWLRTLLLTIAFAFSQQGRSTEATIGLPIKRTYSIEEIGVSRGAQLGLDRIGRLAVISGHHYAVLNDNTWINIAEQSSDSRILLQVVNTDEQHSYFGSLAMWGELKYTHEGKIQTHSLRPENYPEWINFTNFSQIVTLPSKVFFAGTNGIVYLDQTSGEQRFIEVPELAQIFSLGSKLYVSSHSKGIMLLDLPSLTLHQINSSVVVFRSTLLDKNRVLVSTKGQKLLIFDGKYFREWPAPIRADSNSSISCIQSLPDGGVAIALDGRGLYLFSSNGECRLALTTSGYRRIYDIIIQDSGILWFSTESSIQKLLYNNPVSVIDQESDLIVGWPQVVQWKEETVIASNGWLYKMLLDEDSLSYRFKMVEGQPTAGSWAIDANDHHLLVGNSTGVYAHSDSSFNHVLHNLDTSRLFLPSNNLCIVIGQNEIAAIRWNGEEWKECAPRIPGVGFPSVVKQTSKSVWIELGLDRVARIWFSGEELHSKIINSFPWKTPAWVNIGTLANLVVFTGPGEERAFFDEEAGEIREAPELKELLLSSPFPIIRMQEDDQGVIWASHDNGVLTFHPQKSGYHIDSYSLNHIRDQFPVIKLPSTRHVWVSTESALYHVDRNFKTTTEVPLQPTIVSITDGKTGKDLYAPTHSPKQIERLPYSRNHLIFRFFTRGYSAMQSPSYEFTIKSRSDEWTTPSDDSLLTLPNLKEGDYQLKAQLKDGDRNIGIPLITEFVIEPPWYRAIWAYLFYSVVAILVAIALLKLSMYQAKRKHTHLETLVRERTEELRSTMEKLTNEARNTATLEERNRLAGEIHDSVQQGLSGLILQLDATLKHDNLKTDLRNRLSVARRMVSFTRQEVQQAVWGLESPLLKNENLDEALRNITKLLEAGSSKLSVETSGTPSEIPSGTKHHVLRIAQETITNAIRHSNAKQIMVKLKFSEKQVTLEVRDDGDGFDPSEIFTEGLGHFGLRGLRTRAAKIAGDLKIDSELNKGTLVSIAVPLNNKTSSNSEDNE